MTQPKEKHLRPVPVGGTVEPNTVAQAALRLLEHNISVVPTDPVTKKATIEWTHLKETHLRPEEVLKYFRGQVSVAAICGLVSEYLECLDFDCRSILYAKYKELVDAKAPGLLDRLLTQRSQNLGMHKVYRTLYGPGEKAPGSKKLARLALEVDGEPGSEWIYYGEPGEAPARKEDVEKAGGKVPKAYKAIKGMDGKSYILPIAIETRGEGGYFLVAPSAGYTLVSGSFDDIPVITPEERQILHDCAIELDEGIGVLAASDTDPKKWREHAREGEVLPGDRFNTLASMAVILVEMGWTEAGPIRRNGRFGLVQYWTRPGKDSGVSGTLFLDINRFYVFTDNALPLEQEKTYDAFGLYVRHEHGGLFGKAAAHLMEQGVDGRWTLDGENQVVDLTPTAEELDAIRVNIHTAIHAVEDPKGKGFVALTSDLVRRIARSMLTGPVKVALLKEIKDRSGAGIGELKAELKAMEKEAADDAERISQNAALNAVIAAIGRENIIFNTGSFRLWGETAGVWATLEKPNAEALVQRHLREICPGNLSSSYVRSITDMLRNEVMDDNPALFNANDNLVNVLNGTLELDEDLCCWDFRDARREDYLTVQLPVTYDQEAAAPRFKQYLQETFEGDKDADDKRKLLCEMLGYCLLPTTKWERFFLFYGVAGSGKSRIPLMLESMVGHQNYCAVAPDQWGNRFQLAHLDGKLVNNVDELKEGQLLDDSALKKMVSGMSHTAEHKGQTPFNFRPFCRLVMTSNHVPDTRDFSRGVFRRAVLLEFNRVVPKHLLDPNLLRKFKKESSGILNLALEAYCGVILNKGFTIPASSLKAVMDWERETNKANDFMDECCIKDPKAKTGFDDVYRAFRSWAEGNGYASMSSKAFSKRMRSAGFGTTAGSGNSRIFKGLKLVGRYVLGVQEIFPDEITEEDL